MPWAIPIPNLPLSTCRGRGTSPSSKTRRNLRFLRISGTTMTTHSATSDIYLQPLLRRSDLSQVVVFIVQGGVAPEKCNRRPITVHHHADHFQIRVHAVRRRYRPPPRGCPVDALGVVRGHHLADDEILFRGGTGVDEAKRPNFETMRRRWGVTRDTMSAGASVDMSKTTLLHTKGEELRTTCDGGHRLRRLHRSGVYLFSARSMDYVVVT